MHVAHTECNHDRSNKKTGGVHGPRIRNTMTIWGAVLGVSKSIHSGQCQPVGSNKRWSYLWHALVAQVIELMVYECCSSPGGLSDFHVAFCVALGKFCDILSRSQ